MSLAFENRVRQLEQAGQGFKVRFLTVEEDDPDREEKISQAQQECKLTGEHLVVWDLVDGSL